MTHCTSSTESAETLRAMVFIQAAASRAFKPQAFARAATGFSISLSRELAFPFISSPGHLCWCLQFSVLAPHVQARLVRCSYWPATMACRKICGTLLRSEVPSIPHTNQYYTQTFACELQWHCFRSSIRSQPWCCRLSAPRHFRRLNLRAFIPAVQPCPSPALAVMTAGCG